jgi:hypothetical protein
VSSRSHICTDVRCTTVWYVAARGDQLHGYRMQLHTLLTGSLFLHIGKSVGQKDYSKATTPAEHRDVTTLLSPEGGQCNTMGLKESTAPHIFIRRRGKHFSLSYLALAAASALSLAHHPFECTVAADTSTWFHSTSGDIVSSHRCSHWHTNSLSAPSLLIRALDFHLKPRRHLLTHRFCVAQASM